MVNMPRPTSKDVTNEMEVTPMVPMRRRIAISQESLGRYSENTLHSGYRIGRTGSQCRGCITRIPYATLIATIMCIVGVGVFCGTMYRGAMLAVLMFDQVFHLRLIWHKWFFNTKVETVQMVFVVIGASMGALGLMILFVGCLATGATRTKVYRAWGARVGGRISCAVMLISNWFTEVFFPPPQFLGITYVLQVAWLLMLCVLINVTLIFTIFWALCSNPQVQANRQCIDFRQFSFMFPNNTRPEDMEVCDTHELKLFCKDYVERAEIMFILATVACLLVILSLVHYLMCLSANYAHIRDHEKFQELQDLQCLQEPELSMGGSKDRF
uniref:Uncharacterized protein n=1 Tax=Timema shepardi TaxID=629360 RepID=A0A7R9AWY8_TIMSH|nr:unnamed protein product [Timema shepardi]